MNYPKNTFRNNLKLFCTLFVRDLHVMRHYIKDVLIDSLTVLIVNILSFGYLLPYLGMPPKLTLPIFLGSSVSFLFFTGYAYSMRLLYDLTFTGYFNYRLTLPLPKRWLFAEIIAFYVVETTITVLPLLIIGTMQIGGFDLIKNINIWAFIPLYFLMLISFGIFYIALALYYEFKWFKVNVWPRRLSPLHNFGCCFFVWKTVYAVNWYVGIALLFNPITYYTEGLRRALLGSQDYLPLTYSFIVVFLVIALSILFLYKSIYKRLDPA